MRAELSQPACDQVSETLADATRDQFGHCSGCGGKEGTRWDGRRPELLRSRGRVIGADLGGKSFRNARDARLE